MKGLVKLAKNFETIMNKTEEKIKEKYEHMNIKCFWAGKINPERWSLWKYRVIKETDFVEYSKTYL